MKKFSFKLDKVLSYKIQIENSLRGEHARAVQAVAGQEAVIQRLEETAADNRKKLNEEKKQGSMASAIRIYYQFLENMMKRIEREKEILVMLKEEEEEKRIAVIAAKTETSSIHKLKEKKLLEYDKIVQKEEERLVEEFVVNTAASAGR